MPDPFLAYVPILCCLKTPDMGTSARNGLDLTYRCLLNTDYCDHYLIAYQKILVPILYQFFFNLGSFQNYRKLLLTIFTYFYRTVSQQLHVPAVISLSIYLHFSIPDKPMRHYVNQIKMWYRPATLLRVTLLHGCFSRFLKRTNSTKSCNVSQIPNSIETHINFYWILSFMNVE